jgi:hypothetical protein
LQVHGSIERIRVGNAADFGGGLDARDQPLILEGLIGGAGLGKLVATQLYGVGALDAPTFLLVPALVLSVAGVAALLPVGSAVARDPLLSLRRE